MMYDFFLILSLAALGLSNSRTIDALPEGRNKTLALVFSTLAAIFCAALLICQLVGAARAAEVPQHTGYVTDLAGALTAEQITKATAVARRVEERPGKPQVVALIVKTIPEGDLEAFAHAVYRSWGIGQAGKNNGALVLIATQDRKLRIEVGYGLEGAIPDSRAKRITSEAMVPKARDGDFGGAVLAAFEELDKLIAAEATPDRLQPASEGFSGWWFLLVVPIFGTGAALYVRGRRREREAAEAARARSSRNDLETLMRRRQDQLRGTIAAGTAGAVAAAATARPSPRPKPAPQRSSYEPPRRRSDDDSPSYSSGSSSSSSSSSSSDSGSSFSGGGGDSGGGGSSDSF